MISIEAYRLSVGSFNNCKQLNLRTICKGILVGSHTSIRKISGLLRPARFITLFFLGMILINSGDIETNPGPSFSIKTIQGSYHQNNPKYGRTAGTQCMCNSLVAACYSIIKKVHYWTTWDLDTILDIGNETYSGWGYTDEYLSFEDLPSILSIGNKNLELQKSQRISGILENDTTGFLHFAHPFSSSVFTANGLGTAIMHNSRNIYIFDPHSRDHEGFISPNGTSVLLKFNTLTDVENYYKHVLLIQANKTSTGYEYQLYSVENSDSCLKEVKEYLCKSKDKHRKRKVKATNECKSEKIPKNISDAERMVNYRENLTPEKKNETKKYDRERKLQSRIIHTPEKKNGTKRMVILKTRCLATVNIFVTLTFYLRVIQAKGY